MRSVTRERPQRLQDSRRSKRHVVVARVRYPVSLSVAVFAQTFYVPNIVVPRFTSTNIERVVDVQDDLAFGAPASTALVSAILQHLTAEFQPPWVLQLLPIGHSATVESVICQSR